MKNFFKGLLQPSPEAQRLIDLEKARIQAEADKVKEGIKVHRDARIAQLNAEHAARIAPIEESIAARKQEIQDLGKKALFNSACMSLMMHLSSEFTRSLARNDVEDVRIAMNEIRTAVQTRIDALKANATTSALSDLEEWATEHAGTNESSREKVREAFANFRGRLEKDRIALA